MKKNNGFTLIEMMVTIAIFAIIAAMAAPAFGKMVTRQKLNNLSSMKYFSFLASFGKLAYLDLSNKPL